MDSDWGNPGISETVIQSLNAISNIVLCITVIVVAVLYKLNNSKMNEIQLEKIKILKESSETSKWKEKNQKQISFDLFLFQNI